MVNQPTTAQLLMAQQGGQDINVLLQRQRVEQQQAQIEKQQEQFRIQQEEQLAEQQSQQAEINKWKEIVQVAHKIASESPLATYGATSEEKRLARELLKGKYELAPVEIREYAKARIERGKASPTPSLHLEKGVRVETPMYEYESDTGQTIIGTKEFVESKIAAEQTAHPFSGTITEVPAQKLVGVNVQDVATDKQLTWQTAKGFKEKTSQFLFGNLPGLEQQESYIQIGAKRGFIEHPIKTAVIFGSSLALPQLVAAGGAVAGAIGLGKVATIAAEGLFYTAPVVYGGITIKRVSEERGAVAKLEKVGEIISTEISPSTVGGYLGTKGYLIGQGLVRTIGRKDIPTEEIVPKDVLSGRKIFPEAGRGASNIKQTQQIHLKKFLTESQRIPGYKEPMGYHATADYSQLINKKGLLEVLPEGEDAGLFISYGVSPHFLRVSPSISYGKANIVGGEPGVAAVIPKKFTTTPTNQLGVAYIRGTKAEVEAQLPIGTLAALVSKEFRFTYAGVRIPIDIFKTVGVGKGSLSFSNIASSYSRVSSYALSPSIVGSTSIISLLSSKISSPSSPTPSSVPTPSSSYKIRISSSPTITSSSFKFTPSGKPSINSIPSPTPSSVPGSSGIPSGSFRQGWKTFYNQSIPLSLITKAKKLLSKGYKTFYYLKGKKKYIGGIAPRTKAIKIGESKVLSSISARFGIESIDIPVTSSDLEYTPSARVFRGYKIKGQARIPLQDQWIQRAGTRREPTVRGARLAARSEVRELLSYRKSKRRGLFR